MKNRVNIHRGTICAHANLNKNKVSRQFYKKSVIIFFFSLSHSTVNTLNFMPFIQYKYSILFDFLRRYWSRFGPASNKYFLLEFHVHAPSHGCNEKILKHPLCLLKCRKTQRVILYRTFL